MSFPETILEKTKIIPGLCQSNISLNEMARKIASLTIIFIDEVSEAVKIANDRYGIPCGSGFTTPGTFTKEFFSMSSRFYKENNSDPSEITFFIKVELLRPLEKPTGSEVTCSNIINSLAQHPDYPNIRDIYVSLCKPNALLSYTVSVKKDESTHENREILS